MNASDCERDGHPQLPHGLLPPHQVRLIGVWIAELKTMDPFKLTNAAMLEPLEPYLAKLEAEAVIAMCHPHASVRLPAVELLYETRRLGDELHVRLMGTYCL